MSLIESADVLGELERLDEYFRQVKLKYRANSKANHALIDVYSKFERIHNNFSITLAELKATQQTYEQLQNERRMGIYDHLPNKGMSLITPMITRFEHIYSKLSDETSEQLHTFIQDFQIGGLDSEQRQTLEREKSGIPPLSEEVKSSRTLFETVKPYLDIALRVLEIILPFIA